MEIEVKKTFDHYTIYVNDRFWCTCDNRREVDEEIEAIDEIAISEKMWR